METSVLNVLPVNVPTWAKFHSWKYDNERSPYKERNGAILDENDWWYCEVHAWAQVVYTYEPDNSLEGITVADENTVFAGLFGYYNNTYSELTAQETHGSMELANQDSGFVGYTTIKPEYMDSKGIPLLD